MRHAAAGGPGKRAWYFKGAEELSEVCSGTGTNKAYTSQSNGEYT